MTRITWPNIQIGPEGVAWHILVRTPKSSPFHMTIEPFRVEMATHGRRK